MRVNGSAHWLTRRRHQGGQELPTLPPPPPPPPPPPRPPAQAARARAAPWGLGLAQFSTAMLIAPEQPLVFVLCRGQAPARLRP